MCFSDKWLRPTGVTRQHHGTTPAPQTWDHLGACHYRSSTMIPSLWGTCQVPVGGPGLVALWAFASPCKLRPPPASPLEPDVFWDPGFPAAVGGLSASAVAEPPRRAHFGASEETFDPDHDLAPAAGAGEGLSGRRARSVTHYWPRAGEVVAAVPGHWAASSPSGRRERSDGFSRRR